MSIIIGCALTTLVSLCIVKIMEKHPGYTLLDVLTRYLGKWLGRVGMIFDFICCPCYFLNFSSYTLFTFGFYLELQCFNYDFTIYSNVNASM